MSGLVVYNHSTRRSITLPKFEPQSFFIKPFLGYDPIGDVYKVLCLTGPMRGFHVLTLENRNEWKAIESENSHVHFPVGSQICINGVLYYGAYGKTAVTSFDVRSEKLDLIKGPVGADFSLSCFSTMIRYDGKLATMSTQVSDNGSMVFWILEDAMEHKWSKKVFVLPNSWTSLAHGISTTSYELHRFVHVTDAGELMVALFFLSDPPYYVLCYDPKRNNVRKVVIKGITEHKLLRYKEEIPCALFSLFSNQAESLMFL